MLITSQVFNPETSRELQETFLRNELCGNQQGCEQYEMFRYTAFEDLEAVFKLRDHPHLETIIDDIKNRRWKKFLDEYRQSPEEAHFILMAAYRYGTKQKLSSKQTATAFYFLSAAIDDPNYILWNPGTRYLSEDQISTLDESEQVTLSVHEKSLNDDAIPLLNLTLFNEDRNFLGAEKVLDVFNENATVENYLYDIASTSILEKSLGEKLTCNFGFSNRREYIDSIFNEQNTYALLTPYSKNPNKIQYVHGAPVEKSSIWIARHDTVHVYNRSLLKRKYGVKFFAEFKQMIYKLQSIYEQRAPIKASLIEENYQNVHLSKEADVEDLTTRLIDEFMVRYLDGELVFPLNENDEKQFSNKIEKDLKETMDMISFSTESNKNHSKVFDCKNEAIKTQAIEKAYSLISPALKEIQFPKNNNCGFSI